MNKLKMNSNYIAHRGASSIAPENTLIALTRAYQLGAKWVEFDVMLTACGEAVVIHDETLDRTTNGRGVVNDSSYQYIRSLDAGSWFDSAFSGEIVPTFSDVIELLNTFNLSANVEIKPQLGEEEHAALKIVADINRVWSKAAAPPLISSFSLPVLYHVRKNDPKAMIGLLMHEWFPNWESIFADLDCCSVHVNSDILTPERIAMIKAHNTTLLTYTINDQAQADALISLGVDAIFTDKLF